MDIAPRASLIVTSSFLVIVVLAFVAFIIWHFITANKECPSVTTTCPVTQEQGINMKN